MPDQEMRIPFIIGEFGSCHEETLNGALRGIEVAAAAGCDAYKIQYWSSPTRMRDRRGFLHTTGQYDQGSIKLGWFQNLRDSAHAKNMLFACSVYLPEDVETVSQFVDVFKVSSFESRDRELTALVSQHQNGRPYFISTGMQGVEDDALLPKGAIYLHCVSAYPCPLPEANLGAIEPHEGYSDHTRCVFTGGLAVMAGADYLEVHYRLDQTSNRCPDYAVALTPRELKHYVDIARTAYQMKGPGEKQIMPSEQINLRYRVLSP